MVYELDVQVITNKFDSYWRQYTFSLVSNKVDFSNIGN